MSTYRTIPLTQGYVALVDAEDYDELVQHRWYPKVCPHTVYTIGHVRCDDGRRATVRMHRYLLSGVKEVDHINGNGLDNRRANLRAVTHAQNQRNRAGLDAQNTSGFRGVTWHNQRDKWRAGITVDGRWRHLGLFVDPTDAARAFDAAAIEHFGEFAGYLNFPEGTP